MLLNNTSRGPLTVGKPFNSQFEKKSMGEKTYAKIMTTGA